MDIKKKRERFSEIPSSSLSDIAFLLIVFFMVTTVFMVKEGLITVLPQKDTPPVVLDKKDILKIHIDSSEQVTINGVLTTPEMLIGQIETQTESKNKVVLVTAEPEAKYGKVVEIVGILQNAGVDRMSIKESGAAGEH